jgi:capsular exopolysaccharide synthesis family protein
MQSTIQTTSSTEESLFQQLRPYFNKWLWFVISCIVLVSIAFLYLRYTTNIYEAKASILIKDTQAGGGVSELSALGDFGILGNNFNSVENEIEILSSKRLMAKVVEELNLNTKYLSEGNIKTSETFKEASFKIVRSDDDTDNGTLQFHARRISETEMQWWFPNKADQRQTVKLGATVNLNEQHSIVFLDGDKPFVTGSTFLIVLSNFKNTVSSYTGRLVVEQSVKRGSVVELSLQDAIPERAAAILSQLIVEYNQDATADKNIVASNTLNFIDDRLTSIRVSLDSVELRKENFKLDNNLSDLTAEATLNLESSAQYTSKQLEARTQLSIARDLQSYMSNLGTTEYIPANLTLSISSINETISQYNKLLLDYNKLLETATELNPVVQEMSQRLVQLRGAINSSLNSYIQSLQIRLSSIASQNNQISRRIGEIPTTERTARDIERDQNIVEAIFLYLSQKREETAIQLAVTAPKAKIVDGAWVSSGPVAPKPTIILIGAVIIGLLLPFTFIYLKSLIYNKIENRKDVTKKLNDIPFLGEIPKLGSDESDVITKNDRSVLAESFRILRTNLQYKLSALPYSVSSPLIIVTSTVKGEGKTFVSYNLAMTMANSGKNVLLIGGDIRNPQLHRYLTKGSKNLKGVTEFLIYPEYAPEEFVHESDANPNLKIFLSGAIPPNPAELWMSSRVDELVEYGKANYDAVILDSAPSMLVTDTLLISDRADVTVYVSRANYTEKPLLDFVSDTIQTGKLNNVAMVLNNVKMANFGYGNKYAYSYGVDKETRWDTFLKAIKLKK